MDGGNGVTLRYRLVCNSHHDSVYSCPQREARRYRTSAARRARGRHAWRWREMQRDSETGSAAGVVVGRRACRFTTSHRSAKAANVMASTISSRCVGVVTKRNTGGSGLDGSRGCTTPR
jgi:hypothetical protein